METEAQTYSYPVHGSQHLACIQYILTTSHIPRPQHTYFHLNSSECIISTYADKLNTTQKFSPENSYFLFSWCWVPKPGP